MSKSNSGHFTGTTGERSSLTSTQSQNYTATESLRNHIENPEASSSGRNGIKGAHNKDNFTTEINRVGAKITGNVPNSQLNGVEKISYKMPQKDKYGHPTGEYQSRTHYKTVYDSSKISTETYIQRGLQAANNASKSSGKLGREWTGTDNQGVRWHGYCDSNGNITSFYPED